MALFPTQYKTWEKLQKTGKYKNICTTRINGGYIKDPNKMVLIVMDINLKLMQK